MVLAPDAPDLARPAVHPDPGGRRPSRDPAGARLTRSRLGARLVSAWSAAIQGSGPAGHRLLAAARWVSRPVTPFGGVVLATAALSWVLGWQLGWQELMVVAAACVVALAVGALFTLGRLGVRVAIRLQPARVVVGETARVQIEADNPGTTRVLPLVVEVTVGDGVARLDVPVLAAGATHSELFTIPTHRRAVIPIGPARSLRSDPLGMLRRSVSWPQTSTLFVHPVTIPLEGLGTGLLRDLEGRTTDDTSTSDVELHTLRDYVPGDDRRYVHWRTSARTGRLMVRQFVDTRQSHVALLLSGRREDYAGEQDFETAVSVFASIGVRAVRDQQPISAVAAGRPITSVSPYLLLDGTSAVTWRPAAALADAAAQIVRAGAGITNAVMVTGGRAGLGAVRAATARFSPDVACTAIRVDAAAHPRVSSVGAMQVLTLASLEDLPRLLRAAARR